jgi:hypothetical protein
VGSTCVGGVALQGGAVAVVYGVWGGGGERPAVGPVLTVVAGRVGVGEGVPDHGGGGCGHVGGVVASCVGGGVVGTGAVCGCLAGGGVCVCGQAYVGCTCTCARTSPCVMCVLYCIVCMCID